MAKTLALARELGLVEERYFNSPSHRKRFSHNADLSSVEKGRQLFRYIIVVDFESTCWQKDERSYPAEIIEFPALLVDLETGVILSQFHYYVQPLEQPVLSKFCQQLTGITQESIFFGSQAIIADVQVDGSFPIDIIVAKFKRWLTKVCSEYNFCYNSGADQLCAFLTWTNWDFGVCLAGELKRKGVLYPEQLKCWVDLKALYKRFYARQPKGLKESMNEVGLQFEGREHSGIVDSRNTVRLLHKMVVDGCIIQLTKP